MRKGGLTLALALTGCGIVLGPDGAVPVIYLGKTYGVREVAQEPSPDLAEVELLELPDGGRAIASDAPLPLLGPAIRVRGAVNRVTATDVLALYCQRQGRDVAPGWRDVTARFDPVAAEHVFYIDC